MSAAKTETSAQHASFTIERTYPAAPAKVFRAFADPEAKARWFAGPDEWVKGESHYDFRVGGHEWNSGGPAGGPVHRFDCRYYDIVPDRRIVYAYEMHLDQRLISVSLTTIEFKPTGGGTKLVFTEQGVFLDGFDGATGRESGSNWLLDKLGAALR